MATNQSIAQVVSQINNGAKLENVIPEGADVSYWQRIIANFNTRKPKRKRQYKRCGLPKKSVNYAEAILWTKPNGTVEVLV